jgi:squalene synthase HpnC
VSVDHYENFPVASWLCPPALRPPIQAIYHYARTADDIADEGSATPAERLAQLRRYREALHRCAAGAPPDAEAWPSVFGPLGGQIRAHGLPLGLLDDLLDAFMQDSGNPIPPDRAALIDYCRRSAAPIGRLLLHLYRIDDAPALARSDAVCHALQLINFWQDLSVDLPRGRHYVPDSDLARHGLSRAELRAGADTPRTQALVAELCGWARQMMLDGAPLAIALPGRIGWELRLVVQGGLAILDRLAQADHRALGHRPTVARRDAPRLLWRALRMGRVPAATGTAGTGRPV